MAPSRAREDERSEGRPDTGASVRPSGTVVDAQLTDKITKATAAPHAARIGVQILMVYSKRGTSRDMGISLAPNPHLGVRI
jgi:hypothetical protein